MALVFGALVLGRLGAADSAFNGRWRLDVPRSTALDGWTTWDLVVAVDGSKVSLQHDMTWGKTQESSTDVVDTAAPADVKDFFRVEQRHMAVYPRRGEKTHVTAKWLDDGRTLRVEAVAPIEISQGDRTMRLYQEYRLVEGDQDLVLIELHNTRNRPLVYRFKKVPAKAAKQ
ncbi:hypothetical protein [Horticoccus luteus]|uniref:hypothetical protein n=1 Tax=Horticoccus luteus TaxID=2862869 RepID=UPI00210785DE|nr:hypothetical protein [Horticoccus luteus]